MLGLRSLGSSPGVRGHPRTAESFGYVNTLTILGFAVVSVPRCVGYRYLILSSWAPKACLGCLGFLARPRLDCNAFLCRASSMRASGCHQCEPVSSLKKDQYCSDRTTLQKKHDHWARLPHRIQPKSKCCNMPFLELCSMRNICSFRAEPDTECLLSDIGYSPYLRHTHVSDPAKCAVPTERRLNSPQVA